jgi:uncharacterized protein
MKYYLATIITVLCTAIGFSQDSLRVGVIANVKQGAIQLRWGVNTPIAWKQTNQYGFRLERYTVVRNDEVLATPEKIVLGEVIKPQPLDNWKDLATKNNYAAIIAQAIYGKNFQLSGDDAKGVSKFIALAQELEQRYMVSMYAADLCYPAALLAGWGYEDKNVKQGERYLYRVTALTPEKVMRIAEGSAYKSLKEAQPLPQPQELTALFGDKSVMLTWNYGILKNTYISYYVEKSLDGKLFKRLTDLPLANMNGHEGKPSNRMFYIDSLRNNGAVTYYRVVGVTSFSEEGPASDTVKGQGVNKLIYVPHITRAIPNLVGGVEVEWEFDERGNDFLKSFELQRCNNDKGPFVPVVSSILPSKRKITFDSLRVTNYFIISAIPKQGEPAISFPVLVQPADSIPPAIPTGLIGTVDTLGVVRLTWKKNTDKDLLGYQIYRAQTKGEELIPLTNVAIRENKFVDSIDVRNLNSKVYYAITAVDKRYNQSDKSTIAELQKPDLVPPSPPVISKYSVSSRGILLEWETGQEEAIVKLCLYRQVKGSNENKLIQTFTDVNTRHYTDSLTEAGQSYAYKLIAVTASGLSSLPSPTVTVRSDARINLNGKITDFVAKVNKKSKRIEISWKHNAAHVKEFQLYKAEAGKPITLWRTIKGFEQQINDEDVKPSTQYDYIIQAIVEGGKSGSTAKVSVAVRGEW